MTWYAYFRRMAVELALFFIVSSIVFFLAGGRESVVTAVTMGLISAFVYGGLTYILRQRTINKQNQRDERW